MEPIQFTLTEAIIVKAAQLHSKKFVAVYFAFAVIVALVVSAYFLIGSGGLTIERALFQVLGTLIGSLFVTGCFAAISHFLINPFYARRNFRQQKMLTQAMSISWTDARFVFACADSRTDMAFSDLYGYRASTDLVLLYLSHVLYYAIPRKGLDSQDLTNDLLEKLQAAHVKPR